MSSSQSEGTVTALWRFPVKSMGGESLNCAEITARGVLGDRMYTLIDMDTGQVVSAKNVKLFPDMLQCKAVFVEPPRPGTSMPPVQIFLPDGSSVMSDSDNVDSVLSAHFSRRVSLTQAAADADSRTAAGPYFDAFPLSVLTTSTLAQLSEQQPLSRFDPRRFRMNILVGTERAGFIENDWVGGVLAIGPTLRAKVVLPDPRCVMTTLAMDDLPEDIAVLRTIRHHNRLQIGELGPLPCAGVYSVVLAPGSVTLDDLVVLK